MTVWYLYWNESENLVCYNDYYIENIKVDWIMPSNVYECRHACNTEILRAVKACNGYNDDLKKVKLIIHKCKDCGTYFFTTADEEEWYRGRGMQVPKRCGECRSKRRKLAQSANQKG